MLGRGGRGGGSRGWASCLFRGDWLGQVQMPWAVGVVIGCWPRPPLHLSLCRAWGAGQWREGEGELGAPQDQWLFSPRKYRLAEGLCCPRAWSRLCPGRSSLFLLSAFQAFSDHKAGYTISSSLGRWGRVQRGKEMGAHRALPFRPSLWIKSQVQVVVCSVSTFSWHSTAVPQGLGRPSCKLPKLQAESSCPPVFLPYQHRWEILGKSHSYLSMVSGSLADPYLTSYKPEATPPTSQLPGHPILRKRLPFPLMRKLRASSPVPWATHPTLAQGPHTHMPLPSTGRQNNPALSPYTPSLQYLLHQPDSYRPI